VTEVSAENYLVDSVFALTVVLTAGQEDKTKIQYPPVQTATIRAEKPKRNETVKHFCATTGSARSLDWLTAHGRSCIGF